MADAHASAAGDVLATLRTLTARLDVELRDAHVTLLDFVDLLDGAPEVGAVWDQAIATVERVDAAHDAATAIRQLSGVLVQVS